MKYRLEHSIGAFQPGAWDSVAGARYSMSHAWLKTFEDNARRHGFKYILVDDDAGPVAALVSPTHLEFPLQHLYARVALIFAPPCDDETTGVVFRAGISTDDGLSRIGPVLEEICRRERKAFWGVNNVIGDDVTTWRRHGFQAFALTPDTAMDIDWPSAQAFLAALPKGRRQRINDMRRRARDVTFEIHRGMAGRAATFFELFRQAYASHGVSPPVEGAFFETIGAQFADKIVLFEATVRGTVAASIVGFRHGDRLYIPFGGWRADISERHSAYNLLLVEIVQWCIENGVRGIHAGRTNEFQKQRLGFTALPAWFCLRARAAWLDKALSSAIGRRIVASLVDSAPTNKRDETRDQDASGE